MKIFLLLLAATFAGKYIFAQNSVGIGTASPNATLDVLRGTAPWGTAAFRGTTNISHFNIGASEDTYIRGGTPTSHVILNDGGSGNVGIGTYPMFPLSFPATLGDKISLWSDGTSTHYGMGIMSGLFQVFSKTVNDDIAFGYGSSNTFSETMRIKGNGIMQFPASLGKKIILYPGGTGDAGLGVFGNEFRLSSDYSGAAITFGFDTRPSTFTERMRISGNGNVGVGINDPAFKLDVNGRIRIRTGTDGQAGIWLNNNANTNYSGFIGLENDTYVGLFGNNGAGWKFVMNTATGALKINGAEGNAGQVITSNGGASPSWTSPTNFIYNNMQVVRQTAGITVTGFSDVPGLTQTITTPACKLLITIKGQMYNNSCFGCGSSTCKYDIYVDGVLIDRSIIVVGNGAEAIVTNGGEIYAVGAGTHTIAGKVDGNGKDFFVQGFKLIILVIPQ